MIARVIASLYPGDAPFAPPAEWWRTPLGQVALRRIGHPSVQTVPYSVAGAMLGITRQGVHDLVTRHKLERHPDGGVTVESIRARASQGLPRGGPRHGRPPGTAAVPGAVRGIPARLREPARRGERRQPLPPGRPHRRRHPRDGRRTTPTLDRFLAALEAVLEGFPADLPARARMSPLSPTGHSWRTSWSPRPDTSKHLPSARSTIR